MPRQPSFLPRESSFLLLYEHDDVLMTNIDILTKPKFAATLGFCLRRQICFENCTFVYVVVILCKNVSYFVRSEHICINLTKPKFAATLGFCLRRFVFGKKNTL